MKKKRRFMAGLLALVLVMTNVCANVTTAWAGGVSTPTFQLNDDGTVSPVPQELSKDPAEVQDLDTEEDYDYIVSLLRDPETNELITYTLDSLGAELLAQKGLSADLPGIWSGSGDEILKVHADGSAEVLSEGYVTVTFRYEATDEQPEPDEDDSASSMEDFPAATGNDAEKETETVPETGTTTEVSSAPAAETSDSEDESAPETTAVAETTASELDSAAETAAADTTTEAETTASAENEYAPEDEIMLEDGEEISWVVKVYIDGPKMLTLSNVVTNFDELRNALENANIDGGNSLIVVSGDIMANETLEVNGNVTIIGGTVSGDMTEAEAEDVTKQTYTITREQVQIDRYQKGNKTIFKINSGAELKLDSIVLRGTDEANTNTESPVVIESGGTLAMNDAAITDFIARRGGGVNVKGTLVLNDGARIDGNTVWAHDNYRDAEAAVGGGIYIDAGGSVVMNDGSSVSSNKAIVDGLFDQVAHGGGIAIKEGGAFTMNGGTISGNTVSGCSRTSAGGGICIGSDSYSSFKGLGSPNGRKIQLLGGTISNNSARRGGGIYVHSGTTLSFTNVKITENKAYNGGGIWYCEVGYGSIGSYAFISGNTAEKRGDDVLSANPYGFSTGYWNAFDMKLPEALDDGTPVNWYDDFLNDLDSVPIKDINEWLQGYALVWRDGYDGEFVEWLEEHQDLSFPTDSGYREWEDLALRSKVNGTTTCEYDLLITNNEASSEGGGIACNGKIEVGGDVQPKPETTSISVTKKWLNADGTDTPPEGAQIKVNLVRNGETQEQELTLDAANGWEDEFTDLPKTDPNGNAYEYAVEETVGYPGYTPNYEIIDGSAVITNKQDTTSISVTKKWLNADGTDTPPEGATVIVELIDNANNLVAEKTLSGTIWECTFSDLPVKDKEGNEIKYSVHEITVDGYESKVTDNENGTFTITNTEIETVSVTVNKEWVDTNYEGNRPASIRVQLMRGNDSYGEPVTLPQDGSWTYTWTKLEKGPEWNVEELEVPKGYTSIPEKDVQDNGDVTVTITNTFDIGGLTVTKTVTGSRGDTNKDFTFTVTLDDETIRGAYGDMTFANGVATFTLRHGQSATASGLPAGTAYTVTESDNEGYTVSAAGDTGVIPADSTATAAFTNNRDGSTPPPPNTPPENPTTPPPTPEIVTITDEPTPLAPFEEIEDEDVPLAFMAPATGDEKPVGAAALFSLIALGMMGAFGILGLRREDEE